VIRSIQ